MFFVRTASKSAPKASLQPTFRAAETIPRCPITSHAGLKIQTGAPVISKAYAKGLPSLLTFAAHLFASLLATLHPSPGILSQTIVSTSLISQLVLEVARSQQILRLHNLVKRDARSPI